MSKTEMMLFDDCLSPDASNRKILKSQITPYALIQPRFTPPGLGTYNYKFLELNTSLECLKRKTLTILLYQIDGNLSSR